MQTLTTMGTKIIILSEPCPTQSREFSVSCSFLKRLLDVDFKPPIRYVVGTLWLQTYSWYTQFEWGNLNIIKENKNGTNILQLENKMWRWT